MNSEERKAKFQEIRNEFLQVVWVLALLGGLGIWYVNQHKVSRTSLLCDAETVGMRYAQEHFISGNRAFSGAETRTAEHARSGQYSMLLSKQTSFGFSTELKGLSGTETFLISVWRRPSHPGRKDGQLVASIPGQLHESSGEAIETESGGWEKLELWFQLSCEAAHKTLRVYCWNPAESGVYFDDLSIQVVKAPTL